MKKLLFGITSLSLGGAERVLVDIANSLSEKYDVTIFTIYSKGECEKQLSSKVKLKTIYDKQYDELTRLQKKIIPLKILLNKKSIYKKYIKQDYDVEIAFLEGAITRLFSVKNTKTRKIAWIHNDISQVFGKGLKSKIKKHIDRKIYSKFNLLVFVSKDNFRKFNLIYKDLRDKYLQPIKKDVIYNYIDKQSVLEKAKESIEVPFNNETINFLTVARLVPQKALDRLINIHKRLIDCGLNHNFYVIGDGPEKEKLENMINEKSIGDTFHLLGKKENPYPYIKNADYFCLLSQFEGYGMVLEEAKILGKPIIITDTAAREAVEKYKKCTIVDNNENDIFDGLKKIILNPKKYDNENEEYDNLKIIDKIIKVIEDEK